MRLLWFCLFSLWLCLRPPSAGAQVALGKHPADKMLGAFLTQNTNASTLARGLSNSVVPLEAPPTGINLGGTLRTTWPSGGGGGGSQTPIESDIDYAGFDATNIGTLSANLLEVLNAWFTNAYFARLWNTNAVGYAVPPTNAPASNTWYRATGPDTGEWAELPTPNLFSVVAGSNAVVYATNGVYVVNATATGSGGTGISTNSGHGTNNVFTTPIIVGGLLNNPEVFGNIGADTGDLNLEAETSSDAVRVITGNFIVQDGTITGKGSGLTNGNWLMARNAVSMDSADKSGVANAGVAISNSLAYSAQTNGTVVLEPGVYRITANVVWTNAACLYFLQGAKLSIDSGVVVNIRGPIAANRWQHIFSGEGTVSFGTNYHVGPVYADWFGANTKAHNDAPVPCDVPLQKAIDAARIKRNEMIVPLSSYSTSIKNEMPVHFPATRTVELGDSGFYIMTNGVTFQELWHGRFRGNMATVWFNPSARTNVMFRFNDCRYFTMDDFVLKTHMDTPSRAAVWVENISAVETSVTPYFNTFRNVKIYGHRKGFEYGFMVGMGLDANNERFTFIDCNVGDYERGGWLYNGSQSYAHVMINCNGGGAQYGWWTVSSYDPTYAPNGSGTWDTFGGGGGANLISDFVMTGLRGYSVNGWDSESSKHLVVGKFVPVPTNSFAFQSDGLSFWGTNNLVAGFCVGNTNWVTASYTNDYSAYVNSNVWEFLNMTGGIQRVVVAANTRPVGSSIYENGTLYMVVEVGPSGVTNYWKTHGMPAASGQPSTTHPIVLNRVNFSSGFNRDYGVTKDGYFIRQGSRRTLALHDSRIKLSDMYNPGRVLAYGGLSSQPYDDAKISIKRTTFDSNDATYPAIDGEDRVHVTDGDGFSIRTNKVGNIFVAIEAEQNPTWNGSGYGSNTVDYVLARAKQELRGTNSMMVVGGDGALGYYGLAGSGNLTNAAGYRVVYQNDELGTNVTVADLRARSVSGTAALTLTKNHAAAGPLITTAGDGGAEMLRLDNNGGLSLGFLAAGYYGLTPVGGLTNAAGARVAFLDDNFAPDINQVLNAGNDAGGESLVGLANLVATNIYTHRLWNTNEVGYIAPPTNAPTSDYVLLSSGPHSSRWGPLTGGGDALTSGTLGQFAATTSAQLRGVLSDESGSGAAIFAGGNIGAATATSLYINPDGSANWLFHRSGDNLRFYDDIGLATYLFKNDGTFVASRGTFATITNLGTTDAIIYANSEGRLQEAATANLIATATGTPTGSKYLRDDWSWQTIGGGDALTANPLSQFAATTSAQLRGVLSDESGSGAAIFAGGNIGAATATSLYINPDGSANWLFHRSGDNLRFYDDIGLATYLFKNDGTFVASRGTFATITNLGTTDALLYANSEGRLQEATTANVLAHFTGTPTGSKFLRDDGSWQAIAGGGDALTANPLSQFAATTSAQLRGVLSDETGTGEAMFDNGFSADGTNWFNDRVVFTNAAAAASFSAIWRPDLGVWRITNAAAANTYTDIGAGTMTNNAAGSIVRATTGSLVANGVIQSDTAYFSSRATVSATAANGFSVNGGGALRYSGNGVARLSADTAANDSTLWLGQTQTGWPYLTGTSNSTPLVTLGGHLSVTGKVSSAWGQGYYGLVPSGEATNAAGSRVAYIVDTNFVHWGTFKFSPDASADWRLSKSGNNLLLSENVSGQEFLFDTDGALTLPKLYSVTITNSGTTDAIIYGDVNGRLRELTLDTGLSFSTTTLSLDSDLTDLADGSLTGSKVGSGISADNITTGTLLIGRLGTNSPLAGGFLTPTNSNTTTVWTHDAVSLTNVQSTNITGQFGTLAVVSQATNYTLNLLPGSANDTLILHTANTNAFFTFTRTNEAFVGRTVIFNALTSSVNCRIQFISPVRTNLNFVNWVTNGTVKAVNFFNLDTAGTNVLVSDAGTYRGSFTQ